jgi:prostaglandin-endoperoxide synthase 2
MNLSSGIGARLIEVAAWVIERIKPLERLVNRIAINKLISRVPPRPNPLSTMAPYTSWASLTDRTWSGRHLPPVPAGAKSPATTNEGPPASEAAAALFKREGEMTPCRKSTMLLPCFAQWFTDGFLRTDRSAGPGKPRDTRKNESPHEIDLCELYGLNRGMTDQLRGADGLLKSQMIDGEEYPPYLCENGSPKPEFDHLLPPFGFDELKPEQRNALFAMGSDTRNMGFMAFNVLFLREHNQIARRLRSEHRDWDADRVFETTRNILILVLIKVVVEDYINHINPSPFQLRLAPASFPNERWYRTNWMTIEFNLLYRWHSLMPSTFVLGGKQFKIQDTLNNTAALTSIGLGRFMGDVSAQPAGRIGLFNTDPFLVAVADKASIEQGRAAGVASYNDYRKLCGRPPFANFEEFSSERRIQEGLAAVYDSADDVEFYVGLFAEESGPNDVLPPLVLTMVAFDAFSQALTNPLAAARVFDEATFSKVGMEIIANTRRVSDIVRRNVPDGTAPKFVGFTRKGYKRV